MSHDDLVFVARHPPATKLIFISRWMLFWLNNRSHCRLVQMLDVIYYKTSFFIVNILFQHVVFHTLNIGPFAIIDLVMLLFHCLDQ